MKLNLITREISEAEQYNARDESMEREDPDQRRQVPNGPFCPDINTACLLLDRDLYHTVRRALFGPTNESRGKLCAGTME